MPLYEYRCRSCGERTEVLQHLDEAPMAVCPRCGGAVEKMLSAPALQFKGSGWYVTDYGRGGTAAKRKEPTEKGESSGASKGEPVSARSVDKPAPASTEQKKAS